MTLSRRNALLAGASLPFAGATLGAARPSDAQATAPGTDVFRTIPLGAFEVTTLLNASRPSDDPQSTFGMNVSAEEFAAASAEAFIPADRYQAFVQPSLVNTGSELVLFDAGFGAAGTVAALAAAGVSPDQIDIVVITHMHPDHINGLMTDGAPTFPNARYVAGQVEFDHWSKTGADFIEANVMPFADNMTFIGDGGSVVSGITGMAAFGHSPGHMVFMIEIEGAQLVITADLANHHVWSLAYPEWEVRFDADKAAAAASRRNVLGMLAADRVPMLGYHLPFPGLGYVETRGDGFRFVPATYQLTV